MNFAKSLLGGVAVLLLSLPTLSNAQTVVFNGVGSSALFLELGEAAWSQTTSGGYHYCLWTIGSGTVSISDTGINHTQTALTDSGQAWVAWTPGSTGGCTDSDVSTTTQIYAYIQADSVIGNRALFNADTTTYPTSDTSSAGLINAINSSITEHALPGTIGSKLNGGTVSAAGTDIRPEDAKFAINRAINNGGTETCGTTMGTFPFGSVSTNQYEYLGYTDRTDTIQSYYGGSFKVINFNLPSTSSALNFNVIPVGAAPVLVAVNSTDASGSGFNSSNITNLNRSTLALYLDGSIGLTADALTPGSTQTMSQNKSVITLIREPLSGTYNTMEYSIPNSLELQTSQDVGQEQNIGQKNCTAGGYPLSNPMNIENSNFSSYRRRAIGTGQELSELFSINDALGYAFWSVANFKNAPSTAKYLKIDGVDPIENNYTTGGIIPTPTNGYLTDVTFAHVKDGTYPIWSLLRLVTTGSTTYAQNLATAAQNFSTASYPDFVPYTSLNVERSHFTSPNVTTPAPQNGVCGLAGSTITEIGGDVGGVVIPCQVDYDYATTTGSTYINHRL